MERLAAYSIISENHFARFFDNDVIFNQIVTFVLHASGTLVLLFNECIQVRYFFFDQVVQVLERLKAISVT